MLKVLIFCRYPEPGRVKTRLIPALGPEGAARLHRRMSEAVLQTVRRFIHQVRAHDPTAHSTIRVCYSGGDARSFRAWLGSDLEYQRQTAGDLGRRLSQAVELAFLPRWANQSCDGLECGIPPWERKNERQQQIVLVLGSDLPGLTSAHLDQALQQLTTRDLVLGPAADGGYYLLGLKKNRPELFRGIAWGSPAVQTQTLAVADRLDLSWALLPILTDIDRPADLPDLAADPRFSELFGHLPGGLPVREMAAAAPQLTVIIPTRNEAAGLAATLTSIKQQARNQDSSDPNLEIIVADGGSNDTTRQIAAAHGALVIETSGGRAAQLNAGAARAQARQLLFLHADTRPPPHFPELIRATLADPATVAGAFRLRIGGPTEFPLDFQAPEMDHRPRGPAILLQLINWGANIRARLGRLPYGDQGLFLEKRVFDELGGYAPLPIMEDFELVRSLGRRGRIAILPAAATTSPRRWLELGVLRTWVLNQWLVAGSLLGVSPDRLARIYRRRKATAKTT